MAEKKTKKNTEKPVILFSKEQILGSNKYANRRDVLGAILSDNDTYTLEKVDSLLDKFLKGKVK